MSEIRWIPGRLEYPGYRRPIPIVWSLRERLDKTWRARPEELKRMLAKYGDVYTIETPQDLMRCVAWLAKPMEEILDEMEIPRGWEDSEFIYFDGPPRKTGEDTPLMLRVVVPRKLNVDKLTIQPMMTHIPALPIFSMLKPLSVTL